MASNNNRRLVHPLLFLGCLLLCFNEAVAVEYIVIGVTGLFEEGFPSHPILHYTAAPDDFDDGNIKTIDERNSENDNTNAIFLGRGVVRGYRAFLDITEPGWREYHVNHNPSSIGQQQASPMVNSHVIASGCREHAHEFSLYLVDTRQLAVILQSMPRFTSLTADTGSVDLDANGTTPLVSDFFRAFYDVSRNNNIHTVAIALMTCVHFRGKSHIPMPPVHKLDDGTMVTSFPDSLALWAQVRDGDRTAVEDTTRRCSRRQDQPCPPKVWVEAMKAEQRYWNGIRETIRQAEQYRPSQELVQLYGPPFRCKQKARFGVGREGDNNDDTTPVRLPRSLTPAVVKAALNQIGYEPKFPSGSIEALSVTTNTQTNGEAPDL
ncbi:expressed unknown protein [Seminavis robusta]|uniref:Uncharacterized protein n=1 Tax=Seminavis robusta TaxID=568900 RepID=A0A9N8DHV2_9STRA|nr:expressed unknown protein [Seminavis robusta]|eukprot:Sro93_g048370.1 n/a (378) ;mRNA; f:31758-32891